MFDDALAESIRQFLSALATSFGKIISKSTANRIDALGERIITALKKGKSAKTQQAELLQILKELSVDIKKFNALSDEYEKLESTLSVQKLVSVQLKEDVKKANENSEFYNSRYFKLIELLEGIEIMNLKELLSQLHDSLSDGAANNIGTTAKDRQPDTQADNVGRLKRSSNQ